MSKSIFELVDQLPKDNLTVKSLQALDFVIPGQWTNLVGFENTIRTITGETDEDLIQQIGDRAVYLFNDKSQGYQTALWLYQTIDSAGSALGTAALANKISENVGFLSFLGKVTPKADKAQTIDLSLKVIVELLAFCQINGIPGNSIGDFLKALGDYGGESLMRMAALVCFDGLLPLGPDFILYVGDRLGQLTQSDLKENQAFNQISKFIPGGNPETVAPVAILVVYLIGVMVPLIQIVWASVPAAELNVMVLFGFTKMVPVFVITPQPPVSVMV